MPNACYGGLMFHETEVCSKEPFPELSLKQSHTTFTIAPLPACSIPTRIGCVADLLNYCILGGLRTDAFHDPGRIHRRTVVRGAN